MQYSIRQHISRIKTPFKQVTTDSRLTDRFIYLLLRKHRGFLLKKENDWLLTQQELYQSKTYTELIDVDSVEACGIQTDCTIKRTRERLENIVSNINGEIIQSVTSLDGSVKLTKIRQSAWIKKQNKTTSKYDKTLYYWILDGYAYFPNTEWDAVKIVAYFDEDINNLCEDDDSKCKDIQDTLFRIPEKSISEMDQLIYMDLQPYIKLPTDVIANKHDML
jgi:hypothetical protein